jgi:hypothetical protein
MSCDVMISLQFGHGGEAVEDMASVHGAGIAATGFNSATAVKPWKTARVRSACRGEVSSRPGERGQG